MLFLNHQSTSIWFNILESTTIRSVQVRTTCVVKWQSTMKLVITTDDHRFATYVTFIRKTLPQDKFMLVIIVRVKKKRVDN
jgi:hypothetical protein